MKVLIVDDEIEISELISIILKKENIESKIINDPNDVLSMKSLDEYSLILMDIMMPGISGTELCAKIRDKVNVPIIFVTAKSDMLDKMVGYEVGGDDYITKPFDNNELLLKVKSHLRMNNRIINNKNNSNYIEIGEIKLHKDSYEVERKNEKIDLTTREFELLRYLMENSGIALSKEQIFENVWESDFGDIGTVAVNIKNLRDKLHDNNEYIITIWGYGYKFVRKY